MPVWTKPKVKVLKFRGWDRAKFLPISVEGLRSVLNENPDDRYMIRFHDHCYWSPENHSNTTHRGWKTGREWLTTFMPSEPVSYKRMVFDDA